MLALDTAGTRVFVTAPHSSMIAIVDISDPSAMVLLGSYQDTDCSSGTCVLEPWGVAYDSVYDRLLVTSLASPNGLFVLDVTDSTAPSLVDSATVSSALLDGTWGVAYDAARVRALVTSRNSDAVAVFVLGAAPTPAPTGSAVTVAESATSSCDGNGGGGGDGSCYNYYDTQGYSHSCGEFGAIYCAESGPTSYFCDSCTYAGYCDLLCDNGACTGASVADNGGGGVSVARLFLYAALLAVVSLVGCAGAGYFFWLQGKRRGFALAALTIRPKSIDEQFNSVELATSVVNS